MTVKGIIILEGADGVGKTTLARELVSRYGAFYIHNGLWPNMWQRHLATVDLAVKKSQQQLVVIDRLYLSEQIYGAVFRGGPKYDLGARCLDRVLQRHGTLTVLCVRRDLKKHLAHFERLRAERPEKFTNIRRVAERYINLTDGNLIKPTHYVDQLTRLRTDYKRLDFCDYDMDRSGHQLPAVAQAIVTQLAACRSEALVGQFDAGRPNLAGNQNTARYLFVGEELSPRVCSRAAPFLWGDGDASAANFLNERLRELKFDETEGLWTNAVGKDDWLPQLFKNLMPTVRVITLGRVAEDRVRELGWLNRMHIPHPQWARRFQAGKPEVYRAQLKVALDGWE